ncbi:hypothetical protein AB0B66_33970 [Catellatospora sp. NPDC049111]|uniref:hypothetical protein n=1 Tax=Catellatospora sp. NPDC049111 TaxID=3155271 RepID=UPI003411B04E
MAINFRRYDLAMRVVGVHGIGNFLPGVPAVEAERQHALTWSTALDRPAVRMRIAYYADLLNRNLPQGGGVRQMSEAQAEMLQHWATALGMPAEVAAGRLTVPVRQIVSWMAERTALNVDTVDWFVGQFLTEVHAYFGGDPALRAACRDRVAATIAAHRPQVVIAHSLGSVVTFETLCMDNSLGVDTLITLGSPLGLPHVVFERLLPDICPTPRRPLGVRKWINIADVGDLIAVPVQLGGRFDVDAHRDASIGVFDFHRVRRYLASPATAEAIAQAGAVR